ncbi:DNA-binding transcriptional regulator, LysR family [Monaibacterium marinum]|uniref:DNA-binding transcriptional regulator, LysR family n=1 Tax=Pontivivens marinum TaxID=1690039 RepID=A0A2C9CPC8_9RHOB|nr:LysR family transcriptional regulator [Monaibacterium marinum]SOH93073.1 DNA-binding transcriptional regulator, LysR family [Monaibacterium marinum]
MDRLAEMEAFIAVVDQGGFTDAARKLNISKSAISKHVSSLEARLGARLLNRTTRRVSPTEIGLAYYDKAGRVLSEAGDADAMVTSMQSEPRGELRLSVPVGFGTTHISEAVAAFLQQYRDVSIHMTMDDRFVELVSEGFDLAIRIGNLPDSSLRARKLGEATGLLVASQDYLDRRGTPQSIEDLSDHDLLHYSNLSTGNFWRLVSENGVEKQVRAGGKLTANNGEALLRAVEAGLGISAVPTFILRDSIEMGRTVEILPQVRKPLLGIYAVYPPGRFPQPKLRAFVEFMAAHFKKQGDVIW